LSDDCCAAPSDRPAATAACPSCGVGGKTVELQTVKAMLTPQALRTLDPRGGFRFCAQGACPIVYYSEHQSLKKAALRGPVFQKEPSPSTPVCYCFGYSRQDFKDKADVKQASQAIASWVKAGLCACEVRNPQGSCCLGNIAKLP
jgi:hypothetical protein